MSGSNITIYGSLILVQLIYAANLAIAKSFLEAKVFDSAGLVLLRLSVAAAIYTAIYYAVLPAAKRVRPGVNDHIRLAICGLFGTFLNMYLFYEGLSLTSPVDVSLIMMTIPIWALIFSFFYLRERATWESILGILLGFAGVLLLTLDKHGSEGALRSPEGDITIFISALCAAIYLVLIRPLAQKYHTLTITRWVFTYGAIFTVPFGIQDLTTADRSMMDQRLWAGLLYVVFATTFFAYFLNAYALRYVNAATVSSYSYIQPIFAAVLTVLLLDGNLFIEYLYYAVLIFTGVYLVSTHNPFISRMFKRNVPHHHH